MRPLVLDELNEDLFIYGCAVYSIKDDEFEFSIKRHDPTRIYYGLEVR